MSESKKLSRQDLEKQVAENLAGWQKALADYQNLQKETAKQMAGLSVFQTNVLILEILPVFDNYRIALQHIPKAEQQSSWAIGLEHILKMWESFLADKKIGRIKTVGHKFDPHIHEAVDKAQDEHKKDQEIVKEVLAGYKLEDKVIRPAKVIVNHLK
ncbi:MAG: nucleotide exchange factor GrpE [Candidatus Komeilibacteria bacterium CG11_big_fil_rev_8_21_14_0_20_36_20]|uniref:Protein GrpE n=1 Tax=Candidatus Komeilibacteria bacterium CG11_big_fil_rev_8_21_14_0_20_36_20 TaxID=1974477 RepID=A0A2H0NFU3_9BACT|nr:MAG: nucleotide exchange factor GrpE [Candidatus Komeilibacteria bacterium CG11_big_fil_rev_8_21_14_0_20_36_20]PIR81317.1 MAG: nucleotide exchange factor GrpE [Candidatus Komeilibacteria bacterium CG10_big_fil_rev_8_21_14_0_10_36_65]PJC54947.1 MAG: nucleotide exchange factor GrpE [Candidatus Komeilibacteria bacterium CG_4_9_14_0_2_um_filter_36_13]